MNVTLDNLLETLHSLVPYDTAQVLLLEAPTRLFLAREVSALAGKRSARCPENVNTADFPVLQRALECRAGVLISDIRSESGWPSLPEPIIAGSWLGIPLSVSEEAIGMLSLTHGRPAGFTPEHLRLAAALAIPVSLAVQNARLREQTEIFRAELERRLSHSQVH